ncbi:hypothetical protein AURDEDRAFT_160853 [Auricularia subglabra TFB-10046 SS5]|nr:hypothetical protein AURDEDRAFT_160853 [Auricularia subglabra TFB-10046 SS5]
MTSIALLPDDLLGDIFTIASGTSVEQKFAVAQVSTRWRLVALNTPHLWARFRLYSESDFHRLDLLLRRTGKFVTLEVEILGPFFKANSAWQLDAAMSGSTAANPICCCIVIPPQLAARRRSIPNTAEFFLDIRTTTMDYLITAYPSTPTPAMILTPPTRAYSPSPSPPPVASTSQPARVLDCILLPRLPNGWLTERPAPRVPNDGDGGPQAVDKMCHQCRNTKNPRPRYRCGRAGRKAQLTTLGSRYRRCRYNSLSRAAATCGQWRTAQAGLDAAVGHWCVRVQGHGALAPCFASLLFHSPIASCAVPARPRCPLCPATLACARYVPLDAAPASATGEGTRSCLAGFAHFAGRARPVAA